MLFRKLDKELPPNGELVLIKTVYDGFLLRERKICDGNTIWYDENNYYDDANYPDYADFEYWKSLDYEVEK